jgi:PAS domain S-box-containing protein
MRGLTRAHAEGAKFDVIAAAIQPRGRALLGAREKPGRPVGNRANCLAEQIALKLRRQPMTSQPMKSLERAAISDEERYRFLFESSPAAVYSIDADGVIQEFNRCAELWGRSPALGDTDERFCGSHQMFRPDGSFMPHDECPMALVVQGKVSEVVNGEVVILRPDGSRITVVVNIRPLTGPVGEVVGAINCFYDVTERSHMERLLKEQADALAEMNRRKDEFLAMLSHELRSPLGPVVNAVQSLEKLPAAPEQRHLHGIVQRQLSLLTRLVDDLMDASRIGSGRVQFQLQVVAVSDAVQHAVGTVRHLMEARSQKLEVSLAPEPIWLRADPVRLEQILVNLLTNGAKYTENGGQIFLSIERQGDECIMRVRDTGIGISAEMLPRVFDLFTQAAPTLDRSKGGLGIGLALVKRLVELHHGRVEARSVLGKGSEFVVTLPAVQLA